MKRNCLFPFLLSLSFFAIITQGCKQVDLFEKTKTIPGHAWASDFKPEFTLDIKDSSSSYKLFVVLRHTEKYRYNNLFINLGIKGPGRDSALVTRHELPLATNERWLGEGMNDIYEHRIPVGFLGETSTIIPGTYTFQLEQIMREDPLEHVLDVGVRVEKQQ